MIASFCFVDPRGWVKFYKGFVKKTGTEAYSVEKTPHEAEKRERWEPWQALDNLLSF